MKSIESLLKPSRNADALAQRIVVMLGDSGPRPVMWFRSYAATEAVFEQAIGKLFLKGQVAFKGKTTARRLVRARRG